jgi:uncharacterized protein (TIGR02058 family)
MPLKRCLIEIGCGVDLHGSDSTKAAQRAIADAFARNNISFHTLARTFRADLSTMEIDATIGVPRPETVDRQVVLASLPGGNTKLTVEDEGLQVPDEVGPDATVIASAAIIVRLALPVD